jgi:hypothetical protein
MKRTCRNPFSMIRILRLRNRKIVKRMMRMRKRAIHHQLTTKCSSWIARLLHRWISSPYRHSQSAREAAKGGRICWVAPIREEQLLQQFQLPCNRESLERSPHPLLFSRKMESVDCRINPTCKDSQCLQSLKTGETWQQHLIYPERHLNQLRLHQRMN